KGADFSAVQQRYKLTLDQIAADEREAASKIATPVLNALSGGLSKASEAMAAFDAARREKLAQASAAVSQFFNMVGAGEGKAGEALRKHTEDEARLAEQRTDFEFRMNMISAQEYRAYLEQKLNGLKAWSVEWMRVYEQIHNLDAKQTQEQTKQASQWKQGM